VVAHLSCCSSSDLHWCLFPVLQVISQDELFMKIAAQDPSPETAYWLCKEFACLLEEHKRLVYQHWDKGVKKSRRLTSK
jgi:hypothetical protein